MARVQPEADATAPWERFIRMAAQVNADKAPHWVAAFREQADGILLEIPAFGGQVEASLALGQDEWFKSWLAGRADAQQTWVTTWTLRDRAAAEALVEELVRIFYAAPLDARHYNEAFDLLHTFVWRNVVR